MAKRSASAIAPLPVGDLIAYWRKAKKLSLRALADKSGLYASQIHRFEHGEQDPHSADIDAIVSGLEITRVEFYAAEARAA